MDLIDLAKEAGLNPKLVAGTAGGEHHSACPECGGNDRFYIQPHKQQKNCKGYYRCRQCGISGDSIQFCRDILKISFQDAAQRVGATITEKPSLASCFKPTKPLNRPVRRLTSEKWIAKANEIVQEAHSLLLQQEDVLAYLAQRGLPMKAIEHYKLGWIAQDKWFDGLDWDIERDKVWQPKGILIPIFQSGKVIRLKTRRSEWKEGDTGPKYVAISGSLSGLNIIGKTANRNIMIIMESELDALAVHHAMSDIAFVVAVGGSGKQPDTLTNHLAKQSKYLLISHDNDQAGLKMRDYWTETYSHAKASPTPIGKDIGEAIQNGLNVREWLLRDVLCIDQKLNLHVPSAMITDKVDMAQGPSMQSRWCNEDQSLIDWFCRYINTKIPLSHHAFYTQLEQEIALGPDSPRAQTRKLQKGLALMKSLIEGPYSQNEL